MLKKALPKITVAGILGMIVARVVRARQAHQKRGFFARLVPHH
jgi:hypothetical protein